MSGKDNEEISLKNIVNESMVEETRDWIIKDMIRWMKEKK